jgi:hypothetical protein
MDYIFCFTDLIVDNILRSLRAVPQHFRVFFQKNRRNMVNGVKIPLQLIVYYYFLHCNIRLANLINQKSD